MSSLLLLLRCGSLFLHCWKGGVLTPESGTIVVKLSELWAFLKCICSIDIISYVSRCRCFTCLLIKNVTQILAMGLKVWYNMVKLNPVEKSTAHYVLVYAVGRSNEADHSNDVFPGTTHMTTDNVAKLRRHLLETDDITLRYVQALPYSSCFVAGLLNDSRGRRFQSR